MSEGQRVVSRSSLPRKDPKDSAGWIPVVTYLDVVPIFVEKTIFVIC